MADTTTADQTAPETASQEVEQETELLQTEPEQQEEVTEGEQPEEEFDEIEHDGAKHKIPKALKPLFLMQSDYTRKTQEVAEQRKAVEAERENVKKTVEFERQLTAEIGRVKVFDETLEQYTKVDWASLRAQNPEQANAAFQDYIQLKDQRDKLASKVHDDLQKRQADQQREFAKRVEEGQQVLLRDIPGWSPELANKLVTYAKSAGLTDADIASYQDNPRAVKLLHSAYLGQQLLDKQKAAARAPVKTDTPVQPLKQVARKPSGAAKPGLHDDLSPDEWRKRRDEQLRKSA